MATDLQRSLIGLVRAGMEEGEFNQDDLAFLAQKSPKHISQMLSGKAAGTLTAWQQLLDILGIDVIDVFKTEPAEDEHVRPGPFRCLIEGCVTGSLKNRRTLWQHLRGMHDTTLAAYIEQFGEPVPMTPEEVANLVVEAACDLCPQVYSTATGTRHPRMALVSHMWGRHAIKM